MKISGADQRDFNSHYEYWDRLGIIDIIIVNPTQIPTDCREGGEMNTHSHNVRNVINNLLDLQECLMAGEDYCNVADIANAIEYLEMFYISLYGCEKIEEENLEPIDS